MFGVRSHLADGLNCIKIGMFLDVILCIQQLSAILRVNTPNRAEDTVENRKCASKGKVDALDLISNIISTNEVCYF